MAPPLPSQSSLRAQWERTNSFLKTIFHPRGPYPKDMEELIRQHLQLVFESYPSLQPQTAKFTHNDGRSAWLLRLEGTVPIVFKDVTYNIPVIIWFMETYPRQSPVVLMNPTCDMVIKRQHPFVDPSGLVSIPYLQNWAYPSSNLVDLVRNLSSSFGHDPPLYSKRSSNASIWQGSIYYKPN